MARFTAASMKGWEYALEHANAIADRISAELPRSAAVAGGDLKAFNRFQIEAARALTLYPVVELGSVNPHRWQRMQESMLQSGVLQHQSDPKTFVFNPEVAAAARKATIQRYVTWALLGVLGIALVGSLWVIALRRRVAQRTRQLSAANERLDLAQRGARAGIWDWDVRSGVIAWSPEMYEQFGLDADTDPAGFDAWDRALHPDDVEVANERIAQALAEHAMLDSEYRVVTPDGGVRWINALGQGHNDGHGQPLRMTGVCFDITARKRAEEEVRRLNAELEERVATRTAQLEAANAELEAFAYSVSHDLRAPLRAIDGFSLMVVEDAADCLAPADLDHLQRVREAVRRMASLIDDLLALSRTSRQDLLRRDVDLGAMATSIGDELHHADPIGVSISS